MSPSKRGGAADSIVEKGSEVVTKLKESMGKSWIIVLVVVAMFAIVLVIMYVMKMVKANKLQNVVLNADMIAFDNREIVPYKIPAENMSLITNGQEYSYSFWVFLGGQYATTTKPKIILQRGNDNTYAGNVIQISPTTSPLIMLDPVSNIMYFAVSTSAVTTSMSASAVIVTNSQGKYTSGYMVNTIDYIPLQRWVNVALVVKDSAMYIYMDGDLYSVTTTNDVVSSSGSPVSPMVKGTTGDLYIGDRVNYTQGYDTLTRFYNYALTQNDIAKIYSSGPTASSWLSWLGMQNYGVRSPVYQINT
jgi:hypothetical protein